MDEWETEAGLRTRLADRERTIRQLQQYAEWLESEVASLRARLEGKAVTLRIEPPGVVGPVSTR